MKTIVLGIVIVAALGMGGAYYHGKTCATNDGPRLAVLHYVQAMKDYRFEDAYDFVSTRMTDGAPEDEWAGGQRKMFELGKVEIGAVDVRAPHRENKNAFTCEDIALVPNVLKAKDRFNNQGSTEFEVYTVVKRDGRWRIDVQETLFEELAIRKWFPDDEIPEFLGQL